MENNNEIPVRGDGIAIEDYRDDYEENRENNVDWGEESNIDECHDTDCKPSLKDGSIRLTGGRDETEVKTNEYIDKAFI